MNDLMVLLRRVERGEAGADDEFMAAVYDDLREMAAAKMAREPEGLTLQPTALVHEAWLRLGGGQQPNWRNRAHFFGAAAEAMRRILIDGARHRQASRHGGGQVRASMDDLDALPATTGDEQLIAVHEVLARLAVLEPRKAELVKLRYFTGLTIDEAAEVMGISAPTAARWWAFARAWLHREMRG